MGFRTIIHIVFNVIIVGIASLLTDISTEMVYPLLPLYLTSARIGATPAIVGLIEGIAESLASLLRVFSGYWSDRLGMRKSLAIGGYSCSTIGKLFLYFSTTWQIVLFGRIVDRFGKGIRTAPRDALIADSVPKERRGNAYGLHRAMDTFGATIGVVLAYFLFIRVERDFSTIFLLSLVPAALAVIVLFLVREKSRTHIATPLLRSTREGTGVGVRVWSRLDTRLRAFILIVFLFNLGNSSNQFLILRAANLGYDTASALLLYLAYNLTYAVFSWPLGRLSDKIGRKALLVVGYAVYGFIYLGFGFASAAWLLPLFTIYGLHIAMTEGVEKALVSDLAPIDVRATMIGLHATAVGIGLLPASLLAGLLWNAFGAPVPFFFGGALGILASVALAMLV